MTTEEIKILRDIGVKCIERNGVKIEFFPREPQPMNLDPVALAKALAPSMPPDSAMLFASSEDIELEDSENPISKPLESPDMA